jgi:hypothetical protein
MAFSILNPQWSRGGQATGYMLRSMLKKFVGRTSSSLRYGGSTILAQGAGRCHWPVCRET